MFNKLVKCLHLFLFLPFFLSPFNIPVISNCVPSACKTVMVKVVELIGKFIYQEKEKRMNAQ